MTEPESELHICFEAVKIEVARAERAETAAAELIAALQQVQDAFAPDGFYAPEHKLITAAIQRARGIPNINAICHRRETR